MMDDSETTAARATGQSRYQQSIGGCLDAVLGLHGLRQQSLDGYVNQLEPHLAALRDAYETGSLPLLRIPKETADLDVAVEALARLSQGARLIVFFGTGGSSLGGQTLAALAVPPNETARPRLLFADNLDPRTLEATLAGIDLAATRFVLTSKSGGTAETLAQAAVAIAAVERAGQPVADRFLAITEPTNPSKANGLRDLCQRFSIPTLDHHTGIGGRFSCLTNVGLLPAMAAGLDARAIRAGARAVVQSLLAERDPPGFAPAVGAAVAVALAKEKGIGVLVMLPYADRLAKFAQWFVQLWAESLGKNGNGTTPLAALGPVDQHSQLQLFMDGPRVHYLTVLRVATVGVGPVIDRDLAEAAGIGFMGGRRIGDVVDAQSHAVVEALGRAGRPVRTIDILELDERTIGALLMHFMIETILAGRLMGVDPFDQPAVELAKTLTRERLARA